MSEAVKATFWEILGFIFILPMWIAISVINDAWELFCHAEIDGKITLHNCNQRWRASGAPKGEQPKAEPKEK